MNKDIPKGLSFKMMQTSLDTHFRMKKSKKKTVKATLELIQGGKDDVNN